MTTEPDNEIDQRMDRTPDDDDMQGLPSLDDAINQALTAAAMLNAHRMAAHFDPGPELRTVIEHWTNQFLLTASTLTTVTLMVMQPDDDTDPDAG
jgi:hypothetical protein